MSNTEFVRNNITVTIPELGDPANVVEAFEDYHTTIAPYIDDRATKASPTFTGTATFANTTAANITANTSATLPANTSIGSVSATEIGYLDGITSSVQTQLNTALSAVAPSGSIMIWSTDTAPTNWLLCNGATVSRTTYATLFAVIGTTYGAGDGSTTFVLPNLVGRIPIGKDANQAEFNALGETGGAKTVTLATTNLPAHTHSINHNHPESTTSTDSHSHTGTTSSNGNHTHTVANSLTSEIVQSGTGATVSDNDTGTTGSAGAHTHTFTTSTDSHSHTFNVPDFAGTSGSTGSGTAFSILPPYIALNYIIKT